MGIFLVDDERVSHPIIQLILGEGELSAEVSGFDQSPQIFDGIEVRAVCRQVTRRDLSPLQGLCFMKRDVIQDQDSLPCWIQMLVQVIQEDLEQLTVARADNQRDKPSIARAHGSHDAATVMVSKIGNRRLNTFACPDAIAQRISPKGSLIGEP